MLLSREEKDEEDGPPGIVAVVVVLVGLRLGCNTSRSWRVRHDAAPQDVQRFQGDEDDACCFGCLFMSLITIMSCCTTDAREGKTMELDGLGNERMNVCVEAKRYWAFG